MLDVLLLCYLKHAHRVEMLVVNTIMIEVTQVGQGELLLDLLILVCVI